MSKYNTLCFSGGGTKGFAFIGSLIELETRNILDLTKINTFIGTSIGSIFAFVLNIGFNTKQLLEFVHKFNFNKLEPEHLDSLLLLNQLGLDNGDKIITILKTLFHYKFPDYESITFKQLYHISNKKLIICSTNFTKKNVEYFDYLNNPDLDVFLAIKMSFCIPGFFFPIKYNNCYYLDGGILDNFPIHIGQKNNTLGLMLYSKMKEETELPNIYNYFMSIFSLMSNSNSIHKLNYYNKYIIKIDTNNYSLLDFKLEQNDINQLISFGKDAVILFDRRNTEEFIKQLLNQIIYSFIQV